ncbi:MAG: MBL fold metallo-hydrolase [Chloroflexi bacterium]|nr:MBL fold metallo-hydrolase [Chloroflexota bacterium]
MAGIREMAEKLWTGDLDAQDAHPVHARYPEGEEILDKVLCYKGLATANTIDTGDGLVMLDTGAVNDVKPLFEAVRRWRPDAPLHAAVFSHHHVDHIFGVTPFERESEEKRRPRPVVYGHANIAANFDRYKKTTGWNGSINVRQFALPIERFRWFEQYRYPDVSYDRAMTFRRGDLTFELHHARGETDDATWTWIPERKIVAPGDLFIWAAPNAGNPQKVQRFAGEWAVALREMAALGAESLIPGHGMPIFGADRVRAALIDTATLLETLEAQVLALMNQGAPLDRVLHEVRMPEDLLARPYLRPIYDHPQFILRNIWRLYGGWYDGEPDNLLPAPRAQQAQEWVTLAGGVTRVLDRVRELQASGDLRLACHLVEAAVIVAPSAETHALRQAVYAERAKGEASSMSRNILNHAALASARGKRDLAGEYDAGEGVTA